MDVALELFTEQGYEGTSLREIAERLGVTKAALYYHFKSKEEIVQALLDEQFATISGLVEWAKTQPPGPATRVAFINRYTTEAAPKQRLIMQFLQENRPALKGMKVGAHVRDQVIELVKALTGPDADQVTRLRTAISLLVLQAGPLLLRAWSTEDEQTQDEQTQSAAMQVALELASR